jgi:hypothetical protein
MVTEVLKLQAADAASMAEGGACRFDLKESKNHVCEELATILPAAVKKFMMQPAFDKFVNTCILYFVAIFEREYLVKALERAQKQHMDGYGYDPIAVESKLQDLEADAKAHKASLSPLYAMVCPACCSSK